MVRRATADFDKARAAVDGDKTNFDSWAALLAVAENEVSCVVALCVRSRVVSRAYAGRTCSPLTHAFTTTHRQDVAKARATFDEFLERFPNCYGYWEKYAAVERKVGDAAGATAEQKAAARTASIAVYERAVAAVGTSPVSHGACFTLYAHACGGVVDSYPCRFSVRRTCGCTTAITSPRPWRMTRQLWSGE